MRVPLPRPLVFCGPSGAGKGTVIDLLMKRFPNNQFGFSVSHTTRGPRDGEEHGVHYYFTSAEKIKKEISEGKFIEHAEVHGRYYGTRWATVVTYSSLEESTLFYWDFSPNQHQSGFIDLPSSLFSVEAVESVQKAGKVCILDIDVQGVKNVKKSSLNPYYVFVSPPSLQQLEDRLRGRGTESEADIKTRLGNAAGEMKYGQQDGEFDLFLTNDELKTSSDILGGVVKGWYPSLQEATVWQMEVFRL
jgi:guanylate kinase